jgi:hypothetical protein
MRLRLLRDSFIFILTAISFPHLQKFDLSSSTTVEAFFNGFFSK